MLRRVPLHPVLVAVAPVLVLWAVNGTEVPPDDGLELVGILAAAGLAVAVMAMLLLVSVRRGALVAATVLGLVLVHGHLWGEAGPTTLGLGVAAVALVTVVWRVVRMGDEDLGRTTAVVNVLAVLAVVVPLPWVVTSARDAAAADVAAGPDDGAAAAPLVEVAPRDGRPDVVWIVPDRLGSEAGLDVTFDLDDAAFTAALEERGFSVSPGARANYPKTSHSLAATLSLGHLDEFAARVPDSARDSLAPLHRLLGDHEVGRLFTAAGYEYDHVGSWWGPTASADRADRVLTHEPGASEFAEVFWSTTMLRLVGAAPGAAPTTHRERHLVHARAQLDTLDRVADELVGDTTDAPRFVFAHVLLPHEPYVLDRDGSTVTASTEGSRDRAENFERQLSYLQGRLLAVLDRLAEAPDGEEPVVLLQADEGPHPARLELGGGLEWGDATDDELRSKMWILSALRVPGRDVELPDDVTAVNVARQLVDEVLGTDLGTLPDRSWIYPTDADYYRFVDVTDRVRSDAAS